MSTATWPWAAVPATSSTVTALRRQTPTVSEEVSSQNLCVQMLRVEDLDQARLKAWHALEERALEGNPFLSPSFILPAMRYLTPHAKTLLLFVTRRDKPHEMIAMAAFEPRPPTHRVPVPHLRAYKTQHSFLSGTLLDRRMPEAAAKALTDYLWSMRWRWQAIEWIDTPDNSPQSLILDKAARRRGIHWHSYIHTQRAALYPTTEHTWDNLPRKDRRNIKRRLRRLQERGDFAYRCNWPTAQDIHTSQRFLDLENMGWKGQQDTSLVSCPSSAPFFREMFANFAAKNKGFITSLNIENEAIAMSANLQSGRTGFAFKMGWDPEYRAQSPGILLGAHMLQHAHRDFSHLEMIDSCADPGSFVERLWPTRRGIKSGIHTMGTLSTAMVKSARALQTHRQRLKAKLKHLRAR